MHVGKIPTEDVARKRNGERRGIGGSGQGFLGLSEDWDGRGARDEERGMRSEG